MDLSLALLLVEVMMAPTAAAPALEIEAGGVSDSESLAICNNHCMFYS
jgi:hypothetical protein